MLFSVIVSAQEQCLSRIIPEGYKCIEGSRGITVYNPGQISEIFGVDAEEADGAILVKYKPQRSAREAALGYLFGTIVIEGQRIKITRGGFFSVGEGINVNITAKDADGSFFYIITEQLPKLVFGFTDAAYSRHGFSLACKEDCSMEAVIAPVGEDKGSYVDLRGSGMFFVAEESLDTYAGGGEIENSVPAKNLNHIVINTASGLMDVFNLTITASPAEGSVFGNLQIDSSDENIKLEHWNFPDPYDFITASNARISPGLNANYGVFANPPGNGIGVIINGNELLHLSKGFLVITSSDQVYNWCEGEQPMERPESIKGAQYSFKLGSCGYINLLNNEMRFKPRTYTGKDIHNPRETEPVPFLLKLNLPQGGIIYNMLLGKFDTFDDSSQVTVQRLGLGSRQLVFTKSMMYMEGGLGNWADFGLSFTTYVFKENRFQKLECDARTQVCKLDDEVRFIGSRPFVPPQLTRCSSGNDCETRGACAGGNCECSEGLCMLKKQCIDAGGSSGRWNRNKLDVLFIGERLSDAQFESFVSSSISNPSFPGLLNIKPFDRNAQRFAFWKMLGEPVTFLGREQNIGSNPLMGIRYVNAMKKKCPDADVAIVYSAQPFSSYANPADKAMFLSTQTLSRDGNGKLLVHEFGHAFGGLTDEYLVPGGNCLFGAINCLPEDRALEEWAALLHSRAKAQRLINEAKAFPENALGCGGVCGDEGKDKIRPSLMSLMNNQKLPGHDTFNEVSEARLQDLLDEYA